MKPSANHKFIEATNVSYGYDSRFGEGKTAEMFQPQSSKSWTMEEKILEYFHHTSSITLWLFAYDWFFNLTT